LRCVALGLVLSALLHGAAAAWWLHDRAPSAIQPETRLVEIDLSIFGPAPGEPPGAPAPAEPISEPDAAQPETLAQAPEPEPVTEPPPPLEEPEPQPEEPTVSEVPPEPVTPPEPEPESSPIPEVQPAVPPPAKPKVVKRTPEKRPERKVKRPAKKPEKPQRPKRQTRTEVARADRRAKPIRDTATGPASSTASTAKYQSRGAGDTSASRSARNAEAAYLAELQRAIARHQQFPSEARRKRQTGVTTLSFVVQRDGRIRQVRVTKSSGNASLDEAAMTAMQRLNRFKPIPAVIDRQEWPMRVPIRFDLR